MRSGSIDAIFAHFSGDTFSVVFVTSTQAQSPPTLSTAPFAPGAKPAFSSECLPRLAQVASRWPDAAAAAAPLALPSLCPASVFLFF